MKLIVGLGNPGSKYEGTRHNMGFITVDKFADMIGADFDREGFKGVYAVARNSEFNEKVIILKPQTFMNLSGESVQSLSFYFKIDPDDILVIYDDMDIKEGDIKLRPGGSAGGHNGMKNIIQLMGTQKIKRIKVGIGKPEYDPINYVLGKPQGEHKQLIEEGTDYAAKAIKDFLLNDWNHTMNVYNTKK